jgi:Flp pilus assembly protein TadD
LLRDMAVVQARLKRFSDALSTVQRLVSLDRKDPDRQFLLGTLYEANGDREHARQTYQAILADHPDHTLTLNNLASLESSGDDVQEAIALARRAVALAPRIAAVQDTLGWALLQGGHAAEAAKVMETARQLAPADPEILYRLAVAQKAAGDQASARQNVQKALWMSANFKDVDAARKLLTEASQ